MAAKKKKSAADDNRATQKKTYKKMDGLESGGTDVSGVKEAGQKAGGKKSTGKKAGPGKKTLVKKSSAKKAGRKKLTGPKKSTTVKRPKSNFYVVGVGASAGGLEAFETFFKNMPSDSGIAFVLVPHLAPKHTSLLPELLQKHTDMNIVTARDNLTVEPDTIYVVPPNNDIAVMNKKLQLIEPVESSSVRLPIDYFFRTLAQDCGEKAVCIILSGMGTDGTLGLNAIKGELGMTMVQKPESAKYDGMPRSAIGTGNADYILSPEKMPEQLLHYVNHTNNKTKDKSSDEKDGARDNMQKLFVLLRTHTGHDFSLYKTNTINRRVERRMDIQQIEKLSDYIRFLQKNPNEITALFREVLIGVTSFFRDSEAFESLKLRIEKLMRNKPANYQFRVWVPGCSTGEEAYSVAILFRECLEKKKRNYTVQIFATDIDDTAIEKARNGIYPASIAADVTAPRLKKYFERDDSSFQVKKEIREMIVFAPQDIIKDPPFTKMDLICCRNLLIYMNSELQKKLMPVFHYALKPDGILFLGTSETVGTYNELFSAGDRKWKIYDRQESSSARAGIMGFPLVQHYNDSEHAKDIKQTAGPDMPRQIESILLTSYIPPTVVIDKSGDILHIFGRTGRYLEPSPGKATMNILEMAREGLKLELSSAIRRATKQKKKILSENLKIKIDGGFQYASICVEPLLSPETLKGLLLVSFQAVAVPIGAGENPVDGKGGRKDTSADKKIMELEKELLYAKESHQTTIEEVETSNEELKSTNEELQSTNEELQSANEEMETSKEELQSLNEELVTVNSELQGKIEELSDTNDDMRNLLDNIRIPTIFLDNNLRIKRFTSLATEVFRLIKTDIGRSIADIVPKLEYDNIVEDTKSVINNISVRDIDVKTKDGYWYRMRIMPYRTIDNRVDGVVITFSDINDLRTAKEELKDSESVHKDGEKAMKNREHKVTDRERKVTDREGRVTDREGRVTDREDRMKED